MRISVAVPSFNYARYIGCCLDSILFQDHDDFEVLIADGGSTDESIEIIERYCAKDARFRLISRSDTGQVDAVQRALSHATGDVICFLNADDTYLCSDAFSSAVNLFCRYPTVDVLSFGGYYLDERGRHVRPVRLRYHPLDSIGLMKWRSGTLQPGAFWRRRVAEQTPFKPGFEYSFDTVFFYESFVKFSWLEDGKAIAGYRLHGANKSVQIDPVRIRELARFEVLKFGRFSIRAAYLRAIAVIVSLLGRVPVIGKGLKHSVRSAVNAVAYLTVYRLPSI